MIFTYKNLEIGLLIIIFICHHWYYKKINTSLSCVLYRRPAVIFRVPNRPISGDEAPTCIHITWINCLQRIDRQVISKLRPASSFISPIDMRRFYGLAASVSSGANCVLSPGAFSMLRLLLFGTAE